MCLSFELYILGEFRICLFFSFKGYKFLDLFLKNHQNEIFTCKKKTSRCRKSHMLLLNTINWNVNVALSKNSARVTSPMTSYEYLIWMNCLSMFTTDISNLDFKLLKRSQKNKHLELVTFIRSTSSIIPWQKSFHW